jgi:AraC-like DNA-binding protein
MNFDKLLSHLNVQVEPFSLCVISEGWRMDLPGPPDVMLHFMLKGSGVVRGPKGRAQPISACSLIVVPRGAKHALESAQSIRHEQKIVPPPTGIPVPAQLVAGSADSPDLMIACGLIKVHYGEALGLFDHLHEVLVVDLSGVPEVPRLFDDLLAEQADSGPGSKLMKACLMTQCVVYLLRQLERDGDDQLPWLAAVEHPQLGRALDAMLDHPGDHHTLDSLADVAGMSRSAFAEQFNAAFGSPPMSMLRSIRLQRAAQLLRRDQALSIDAVSHRVGFASRSYFSAAFKKEYGVSPAEHREPGSLPLH